MNHRGQNFIKPSYSCLIKLRASSSYKNLLGKCINWDLFTQSSFTLANTSCETVCVIIDLAHIFLLHLPQAHFTHVISLKRIDVSKIFFLMVLKIRFATVEGDIEWVSNDLSAGIISTLFYVYFSITSYLSRWHVLLLKVIGANERKLL